LNNGVLLFESPDFFGLFFQQVKVIVGRVSPASDQVVEVNPLAVREEFASFAIGMELSEPGFYRWAIG